MKSLIENPRRLAWTAAAVLIVLVATYPLWAGDYQIGIARDALIMGILALSLDLLWGKAGILSFGQAAFFGVGAYSVAIFGPHIQSENAMLIGLIAGLVIAALVAGAVGYFLLYGGVRGAYLTIVTLALSLVADHVATGWAPVTGGNAGLLGAPAPGINLFGARISLTDATAQYALVAVILAIALVSVWLACRGHHGRVLAAIQDNEVKARSLGYGTAFYLLVVFVISAMIASLAGSLYASVSGFVAPDLVGLLFSTQVIVWVAVGGRGTLLGPVVGTYIVLRLQNEISSISISLWPLLIGAFFVLLVFIFPDGLFPYVARAMRLLNARGSRQ
jgi:branched-chain amino acid transport system permease protein